ncbi:DUF1289 domain-containing protein [Tropicimonas marinistellae]|uniref:DUF1289 domain-containing protein n=1 Tax=Tropicimonas marinistellae TaxID=1739787 RepID=UPI00082CD24A|nr:DUF1289 domain-containing protein [Tropicimonas marinistellae]
MKDDDIWKRDEVESPCVKLCVIHPEAQICTGCLRTLDEIAAWSKMTAEARRRVMDVLRDRAPQLARRRGGRAARIARRDGAASDSGKD